MQDACRMQKHHAAFDTQTSHHAANGVQHTVNNIRQTASQHTANAMQHTLNSFTAYRNGIQHTTDSFAAFRKRYATYNRQLHSIQQALCNIH